MRRARVSRRGIQRRNPFRFIRHGNLSVLLFGRRNQHRRQRRQSIVQLQDDTLAAVFAVSRLVLALDDGEGLHDVVDIIALDAVEVEIERVQLAAHEEAAFFIPDEWRAIVVEVAGEGLQVPSGVGQFEYTGDDEFDEGFGVCVGWDDGKLFQYIV